MRKRRFGPYYGVTFEDLNLIGDYAREAFERFAHLFDSGRIYGLDIAPGGTGVVVEAGAALIQFPTKSVMAILENTAAIDLSGNSVGHYKIVGKWADVDLDVFSYDPPPETLPNTQPNPFYVPNLPPQTLYRTVMPRLTVRAASDIYELQEDEVDLGRVYWNGSLASVSELGVYATIDLAEGQIHPSKINALLAGAGLSRSGLGVLSVAVDNVTIEIGGDNLLNIKSGAVGDSLIGERTVNQSLANPTNTGPLTSLLSWLARSIKAVSGATNWFDAPTTTLNALHSAAALLSENETISGVWTFSSSPKLPNPTVNADAASKGYVDDRIAEVTAPKIPGVDALPNDAVVGAIVRKNSDGRVFYRSNNGWVGLSFGYKIELFQTVGSNTWTKDPYAVLIDVICVGGGSGGGAGVAAHPAASSVNYGMGTYNSEVRGGAGGGGGEYMRFTFVASDVPGSVVVTVGAGGQGGQIHPNAVGATAGQPSAFGSLLKAEGGQAGSSGYSQYTWNGESGNSYTYVAATPPTRSKFYEMFWGFAPGDGGSGAWTSNPAAHPGSNSPVVTAATSGGRGFPASGQIVANVATNGTNRNYAGDGGGGGNTVAKGGNGGWPGGGGGGGCGPMGIALGPQHNGGNGGNGAVVVISLLG